MQHQLFMGSTVWAMLFVSLFFGVLNLECNASRNRISAQKNLDWLESECHFHKYSALVNAQRAHVFTCKLLQQCTQIFYIWAYPVMFSAHSAVIFLTKEKIANCQPSSWSEGNQLQVQLRIQVRGTTPKICNRKLQVHFWQKNIFNKFYGPNEVFSAHFPLRINSQVTVSLENCYFLT